MKNRICLLLIFIALVYSCVSSFKTGKYRVKYGREEPKKFTFFQNSTFIYESGSYYSLNKQSSGIFKIEKGKLILKSDIKDITIPIKASTHPVDSLNDKNRIAFRLNLSEEQEKNYKCIPIINNDTLNNNDWYTGFIQDIWNDKWGSLIIDYSNSIDSVKLLILKNPFISRPRDLLETRTIYFDKLSGCTIIFDLTINDSFFGYRIFDNTVLRIKKNKIVFIDEEDGNKKNTLYLKKK